MWRSGARENLIDRIESFHPCYILSRYLDIRNLIDRIERYVIVSDGITEASEDESNR